MVKTNYSTYRIMDEKQICGVLADAYDSSLERQYCVLDYIREATSFNS